MKVLISCDDVDFCIMRHMSFSWIVKMFYSSMDSYRHPYTDTKYGGHENCLSLGVYDDIYIIITNIGVLVVVMGYN